MFKFFYQIRFYTKNNEFHIKIYCSLDDLVTPVYNRSFSQAVLDNQDEFRYVYQEIKPYLDYKNIKINKDDLRLMYYTLFQFNIYLPNLEGILIEDLDDLNENELTPKEKLFLIQVNGLPIEKNFDECWRDEYQIDPEFLITTLTQKGFVTTSNVLFNLEITKREVLAQIAQDYGLDVPINHNELVLLLKSRLTDQALIQHFGGTHFSLTDKGREVIQTNRILGDFHKCYYRYVNGLSIDEFYLLSLKKPDYDVLALSKMMLVNQNQHNLAEFDWRSLFTDSANKTVSDYGVDQVFNAILERYNINEQEEESTVATETVIDYEKEKTLVKEQEKPDLHPNDFFDILSKFDEPEEIQDEEINEMHELDQDEFFRILSKHKYGESKQPPFEQENIKAHLYNPTRDDEVITKEIKRMSKQKKWFFKIWSLRFILSSCLSIAIIYVLYNYVF